MKHNETLEILMGEKPHKKIKRFDGKNFKLYREEIMTKTGADALAEHLRNRGNLVRIKKEPGHNEYLIYYRGRK